MAGLAQAAQEELVAPVVLQQGRMALAVQLVQVAPAVQLAMPVLAAQAAQVALVEQTVPLAQAAQVALVEQTVPLAQAAQVARELSQEQLIQLQNLLQRQQLATLQ
jgi:hypothetical protein